MHAFACMHSCLSTRKQCNVQVGCVVLLGCVHHLCGTTQAGMGCMQARLAAACLTCMPHKP